MEPEDLEGELKKLGIKQVKFDDSELDEEYAALLADLTDSDEEPAPPASRPPPPAYHHAVASAPAASRSSPAAAPPPSYDALLGGMGDLNLGDDDGDGDGDDRWR